MQRTWNGVGLAPLSAAAAGAALSFPLDFGSFSFVSAAVPSAGGASFPSFPFFGGFSFFGFFSLTGFGGFGFGGAPLQQLLSIRIRKYFFSTMAR